MQGWGREPRSDCVQGQDRDVTVHFAAGLGDTPDGVSHIMGGSVPLSCTIVMLSVAYTSPL